MRVQVILTNEELVEVKKRAGLVPLSRWFKNLALGGSDRNIGEVVRGSSREVCEEARREFDAPKRRKVREVSDSRIEPCKHGFLPNMCKWGCNK